MLRRIPLALATLAAGALAAAPAQAQRTRAQPGFVVLRVVLDSSGAAAAGGSRPGAGFGSSGSSGSSSGFGAPPIGEGSSGGFSSGSSGGPGSLPGGGAAPDPKLNDPTKSVVVVIPYANHGQAALYPTKPGKGTEYNPLVESVKTQYGVTPIYNQKDSIQAYWQPPGFSYEGKIKEKHHDWEAAGKIPQGGYDLTNEAIGYGLDDLALQYAEETVKAAEGKAEVSAAVAAFVKVYKPLVVKLAEGSPPNPGAAELQRTLFATGFNQSAHYALIHFGDSAVTRAVLDRRLALLEQNLKAFYLYYALEGVALPMPAEKMLVLIAPSVGKFFEFHQALDGNPVASDGFYAPLRNLVVLSPDRLDDAGRTFNNYARTQFRIGVNPDELVAGNAPALDLQKGDSATEFVRLMTIALVQRKLDDDSVRAVATREGVRQLLAATGLLNPYISPPKWLEEGTGTFLQMPRGAVYTKGKDNVYKMTVGLGGGYGAANYELSRGFRELNQSEAVNPDYAAILLNTLADKYYDAAQTGKDIDPAAKSILPEGIGKGTSTTGGLGGLGGGRGGYGGSSGYSGGYGGIGGEGEGGSGSSGGFGGPATPVIPGQPDPAAELRELKERLLIKANVYAWGLTYYLHKRKPTEYRAFLADLSHKPRDMRLDPITVRTSFGKAFGLAEKDDPTRLDPQAVKAFANGWIAFLRTLPALTELTVVEPDPVAGTLPGGVPGFGGGGGGAPGFGSGGRPGGGGK